MRASVVLIAGWVLGCSAPPDEVAGDPDMAAPAASSVARSTVPVRQAGVVVSDQEVDVAAPGAARVAEVTVQVGDTVVAGDVVARLDTSAAQAELDVARAELAGLRIEREAEAADAQALDDELGRTRELREQGIVARHEVTDARRDRDRARASVKRVVARIAGVEAHVRHLEGVVAAHELTAPDDGVVAAVPAVVGDLAGPTTTVVRLLSLGKMRVRFAVEPENRQRWPLGQRVVVRPDHPGAGPRSLDAEVVAVAPQIDPAAHLLFVDARLLDPTVTLPDGLSVWVSPSPIGDGHGQVQR